MSDAPFPCLLVSTGSLGPTQAWRPALLGWRRGSPPDAPEPRVEAKGPQMEMERPKPKDSVKWASVLIHSRSLPLSPGHSCHRMPEPPPLNKAPSDQSLGLACDSSCVVPSSAQGCSFQNLHLHQNLVGIKVWQRAAPQRQSVPGVQRGPVGGLVGGGEGRGSEVSVRGIATAFGPT